MPLRFNPEGPAPFYDVLEVKLGCSITVQIGTNKAFYLRSALHWLPAQERTVPCLEEDCPWHHLPIRIATHVPVMNYLQSKRRWVNAVLPVTHRMRAILDGDHVGTVYELFRLKAYNAPVSWRINETARSNFDFKGFDVEPSLRRMWGEYCNYKLKPGAPVLHDDGREKEGGAA